MVKKLLYPSRLSTSPFEIDQASQDVNESEDCSRDIDHLERMRAKATDKMEAQKTRIMRYYNKRVQSESFKEGDLVWKMILPIGTRDYFLKKWSPN
ncbi:hypothetical protein MLD38_028688 [Melastoma candidum]|uniref:Uncharacterized protein n=1 Tax=Melastoma candidum TaxID=119954 RepID=A0ACB9N1U4_9MYRT|nr:hypothetical protein MLD38_028688 [Melastoma candidum]